MDDIEDCGPLDMIIKRLDELEDRDNIPELRAILIEALQTLGIAEIAILEDILKARTGFSARVISALVKEAADFCPGHGYLHTTQDVSEAYLRFFQTAYESIVWVGDSLYVYEAGAISVEGTSTLASTAGFYERIGMDDLKKHLTETFGNLPALRSESGRKEVFTQLRLRLLQEDFFLDARSGVNLRDGFLAMDSAGRLNLFPHSPAHKARMRIEAAYDPEAAFAWLDAAITRTLPDRAARDALQEIAGAILYNIRPTRDAVRGMYLLYGPRNSGKSTLIACLEGLMPSAVIGSVPPENWGDPNYRAALEGLLLNLVTEVGGTTRIDSENGKKIVSCERIIIRRMRRDPVAITPMARHLFAGNEFPRIADKTDAFERRLLVITFPRSLEQDEVDVNLLERFRSDPSAILNWAAIGAARLMETGAFTVPEAHYLAIAEMQYGGDIAMIFAHTQIKQAHGSRVTTAELRDALRAFAGERDVDPGTMHDGAIRKVADVMQKKYGATRRKTNGQPFYEGVSLITNTSPEAGESDEVALDDL